MKRLVLLTFLLMFVPGCSQKEDHYYKQTRSNLVMNLKLKNHSIAVSIARQIIGNKIEDALSNVVLGLDEWENGNLSDAEIWLKRGSETYQLPYQSYQREMQKAEDSEPTYTEVIAGAAWEVVRPDITDLIFLPFAGPKKVFKGLKFVNKVRKLGRVGFAAERAIRVKHIVQTSPQVNELWKWLESNI